MKIRDHQVTHTYQSTNTSCGQTAVAILLSHYGIVTTAQEIIQHMPSRKRENGDEWGTVGQELAAYCLKHDLKVSIYTFDFQIIDLAWAELPQAKLRERLEAAKSVRHVDSLGRWSQDYAQAYIDLIDAGGSVAIKPHASSSLLYDLLDKGPVMACVSYNVLYNIGRTKTTGVHQAVADDLNGVVTNHFVVVYGNDEQGKFLIADPWEKPGRHVIEPERLLCAMTASQVECDNLWITIS